MIHRAKFREKYFVFQPQYGIYRFKTFEEFQLTTGIALEPPRKYIDNLNCLEDMKQIFLLKKQKEQLAQQRVQ